MTCMQISLSFGIQHQLSRQTLSETYKIVIGGRVIQAVLHVEDPIKDGKLSVNDITCIYYLDTISFYQDIKVKSPSNHQNTQRRTQTQTIEQYQLHLARS
jgi:hypothetical protein